MKHFLQIFLVTGLMATNWYCAGNQGNSPKNGMIAEGYCECAAAISNLDKQARSQPDSSVVMTMLLDSMQREFEKANICLMPLRTAHGPVQPTDISEIQRILQKKCPDLAGNKDLITELLCR